MMPLKRATAAAAVAGMVLAGSIVGAVSPAIATDAATPVTIVEKLTGPDAPNNTWGRWDIKATDLGIMWDDGDGRILTAFGDTFGNAWTGPGGGSGPNGNWRSNVLVRSSDRDLSDGMLFESAAKNPSGMAKELIPSKKVNGDEMTTIPTAGIAVGKRQYMSFMSVKQWGAPGYWDTNRAGIAYSDDDGENWAVSPTTWENNADGTDPFQMQAYARKGKGGDIFVFGTPNGRNGAAHVARVSANKLLDKAAYRYWDGAKWVKDESQAVPVVEGPVSELSVQYDAFSKRFLMMTLAGPDIVLRTAERPEGPWTAPQTVASSSDYPGLYGGYFHPWSEDGVIHFAMSQWSPYNVYLMQMQIDTEGNIVNPNLVSDPSFERTTELGDGTNGTWGCTPNCGVDVAPASAFSGDHNAFVRNDNGWRNIWQDVAVEPGVDYRLTGYVRTSINSDAGFFGARTLDGTVIGEAHFVSVGPWTKLTVDFNSAQNSAVQVFGGVWTNSGDIWMQLDDVAVVRR
ncbi:carbohydrate-binding protein [Microbacterium sp. Root61]|nr:carbohydrate-binding protein [Microbacterium sp. Root61]